MVFAGYVAILTSQAMHPPARQIYLLAISCLGFCLSWGWLLALRGGKYWSSNWELHVDYLEMSEIGPLFTSVLDKDTLQKWNLLKAYPHSVGKINQALGLMIVGVWLVLMFHSTLHALGLTHPDPGRLVLFLPLGALLIVMAIWRHTQTDFGARMEQQFLFRRSNFATAESTEEGQ